MVDIILDPPLLCKYPDVGNRQKFGITVLRVHCVSQIFNLENLGSSTPAHYIWLTRMANPGARDIPEHSTLIPTPDHHSQKT